MKNLRPNKLLILMVSLFTFTFLHAQTPSDNSHGVSVTSNFAWSFNTADGTNDYLQVSTNSTFGDIVIDKQLASSATTYTFAAGDLTGSLAGNSNFDYNTTYYWRIYNKSTTSNDEPAGAGTYYTFSTQIETGKVSITSQPGSGATGVSITPTITYTYTHVGSASNVNIVVKLNGTTVTTHSGVSATTTYTNESLGTLDYNTTYSLSIVVTNADEATDNYTVTGNTFTTLLATPTLIDPSGTYATTTTLTWGMSASYSNVDFAYVVATDNLFANTVASGTVTTHVLTVNVSLPSAGVYYWKVTATVNDAGAANNTESTTTTTGSFTLTIPGPALTAPVNGLTGVSVEPTMTWGSVTGAVSYKLYVATASTFGATNIYAVNQGTNLTKAFTEAITNFPLSNGTTYYWKVTALDNAGTEYASSTYHFTTFPDVSPTLTNPANASTVYTSSVLMGWTINQAVGTLKFKLQYQETTQSDNTVPTAGEWAADGTGTDATTVTTTSLSHSISVNGGMKYYWRIVVLNASNEVEDYSSVYAFTTSGGATVNPIPSYPIGGATVYTNSPTLYWYVNEYASGVTYQVRYATASTVNGDGMLTDASATSLPTDGNIATATSAMYKALSGLNPGTTYYWEVRAYYSSTSTFGDWSSVNSFTTHGSGTLVVPTVSYPSGGYTVYTTSPYLYWYVSGTGDGLTYNVQVDDDAAFGSPAYTGSTTTNATYIQASSLTPGTTYHWRVRSYNGTTYSGWSSSGTFAVAGGVTNGYPVASYPVSNPTVYTAKPTLYWYLEGSSLGLTKYVVRYKAGSASGNWSTTYDGTADVTNLNTTYWTFTSDLTYGQTYYWAVASYDGSTFSAWSQGSFTVVGPGTAGAPILSYPSNGTTVYDNDVTLGWYINGSTTGISGYEITYSTSDVFATSVTTTTTSTTNTLSLTGLTAGATYYWKVRSHYSGSTYSGFSSTYHFTVDPGASSVVPIPGSPTNQVTINTVAPVLSWALPVQSESELTYTIEYSTSADFSDVQTIDNVSTPFKQVSGLQANTNYYWRVKSTASNGDVSGYSPVGIFNTNGVTGVNDEVDQTPTEFAVKQNYPNPFNPTTTIKYQLPKASYVSIKVYDILGSEVATLVNGNVSAGYHSVIWNATDNSGAKVNSGVYFYRVSTNSNVVVKKMLLLK